MYEYLPEVASDWRGAEIRPVLRAATMSADQLQLVERRVGRRDRRRTGQGLKRSHQGPGRALESAALATLDKLNRGVRLLDAAGTVRFTNLPARSILHRRHGLALRHNRLEFPEPAAAAFAELLERGEGSLVFRVVSPQSNRGGYRVLVSPLNGRAEEGYCVFIYEPHGGHQPLPPQVLRELYSLTAAEARLTNALFAGHSLKQAVDSLGISFNTGKTTLKRVFSKCEVRTQAELLHLLSLGPRTL